MVVGLVLVAGACAATPLTGPNGDLRNPDVGPPGLAIVVLAGDDLSPLPSAALVVDGRSVPLDDAATAVVPWPASAVTVEARRPGFRPSSTVVEEYPAAGRLEFRLEPVVLVGKVSTPNGFPLPGVAVTLGGARDVSDDEGRFRIERAVPGELELTRPAWEDTTESWDGTVEKVDVQMEPLRLRALRVGGDAAGDPDRWKALLGLADLSAVDALVVEVKDEQGIVLHDTEVPRAHEIGAVQVMYDLGQVADDIAARGLYGIARISVFQDPPLARAEPDHAVGDESTGGLWTTAAGYEWLDPSDPAAYEYSIALAEEACRRGFREIQFDYVSYPFGGDVKNAVFDGGYTQEVRVASVVAYLERAASVLGPMGCAVGTTLLGITLESSTDEGVGQRPGPLSRVVDVLSPTLYSTNYGAGWRGFADPDANAAEIVDGALASGLRKLEGAGYYRPWLQTWQIGVDGVLAVEQVAEDRGMGWMLWSNASRYDVSYLPR